MRRPAQFPRASFISLLVLVSAYFALGSVGYWSQVGCHHQPSVSVPAYDTAVNTIVAEVDCFMLRWACHPADNMRSCHSRVVT